MASATKSSMLFPRNTILSLSSSPMASVSAARMAVAGVCCAVGERCVRRDSGEERVCGRLKEEREHLRGEIGDLGARRKCAAGEGVGR